MEGNSEYQETKYEFYKNSRTHVFIKRCFPFEVGEFINIQDVKLEFRKKIIESKSIAELKYL
jgi:hypothetical protein